MSDAPPPPTDSPPSSVPANFSVRVLGLGEDVTDMALELRELFVELGRELDLTSLDGVTFAMDHAAALLELDRGYSSTHTLTPSGGRVLGVAMTPTVIRDGKLKSHIFVDLRVFAAMLQDGRSRRAFQLLAHECAHVEGNAQFDRAFPNMLLRRQVNYREGIRSEIVLACWDEYVACMRSAPFGEDPHGEYEQTFLEHLRVARQEANEFIKAYRLHGNVGQVLKEVTQVYGNLLKFAAYLLGNLAGHGRSWRDTEAVAQALQDHWFLTYFERLETLLRDLDDRRGNWRDYSEFETIADLGEDLIKFGGMEFYESPGRPGEVGVDIPITPETVPY